MLNDWLHDARWEECIEGRRILIGGDAVAAVYCFLVFAALVPREEVEFSDEASPLSSSFPSPSPSLSGARAGARISKAILMSFLHLLPRHYRARKDKDLAEI